MGMDTRYDRPGMLRQRNPEAAFTEGIERSNVETIQGLTDVLFANKEEMAKRTQAQLSDLMANATNSYGRARAVGMTAAEASKMVDRAFQPKK